MAERGSAPACLPPNPWLLSRLGRPSTGQGNKTKTQVLVWEKKLEQPGPRLPMLTKWSLLDGQSLKRVLQGPIPTMPPQGSPPGLRRADSAAPCLCSSFDRCEHQNAHAFFVHLQPRALLGQGLGLVQLSDPRAQGKACSWEELSGMVMQAGGVVKRVAWIGSHALPPTAV